MATKFSNALFCTNSPVANIRAWAQFVEDVIVTTGGWVVTTDTGQTLPSALAVPGGINTKVGYRIYRMNDTLQATAPVFIRMDFGSGGGNLVWPAFWLTIGTGSDGAGNITGTILTPGQVLAGNSSAVVTMTSYGSADTSRFVFALFVNASNDNYTIITGLERSKDTSGSDTSDGLILITSDASGVTGLKWSQYLIRAGGTQPASEAGLAYVKTNQNPTQIYAPGEVGAAPIIPFKGVAMMPGTNFMIVNSSDVAQEGSFSMTLYGATRVYQQVRVKTTKTNFGSLDANARVCIRYD